MARVKCPHCQQYFIKENEEHVPYNRKYFHIDCFEAHFEPEVVDKHWFYLTFQDAIGRVPTSMEWTQCQRLIDNDEWSWTKLEDLVKYVYLIEGLKPTEEHGVIGILPYYEFKAKKFISMKCKVMDSPTYRVVDEGEVIYVRQPEVKVQTRKMERDTDSIWDDEDFID